MTDPDDLPTDRLTRNQAAAILGVPPARVSQWVRLGQLPTLGPGARGNLRRADVERLSAARWQHGDPSWLTSTQVAAIMGVSVVRVRQLARGGRLPFEWGLTGNLLFRPGQVAVIARARRERFHTSGTID